MSGVQDDAPPLHELFRNAWLTDINEGDDVTEQLYSSSPNEAAVHGILTRFALNSSIVPQEPSNRSDQDLPYGLIHHDEKCSSHIQKTEADDSDSNSDTNTRVRESTFTALSGSPTSPSKSSEPWPFPERTNDIGNISNTFMGPPEILHENTVSSFTSDDSLELDSFIPGTATILPKDTQERWNMSGSSKVQEETSIFSRSPKPKDAVDPSNGTLHFCRKNFSRKQYQPSSALSRMIHGFAESSVPPLLARFATVGAPAKGRNSMHIRLHFPMQNGTEVIDVNVRANANADELIGYGLLCYFDQSNALDSTVTNHARGTCLSTQAWALRLVEDGIVDEDCPALDRSIVVGSFGENEFAICAVDTQPKATAPEESDKWQQRPLQGVSSPPTTSGALLQVLIPSTAQHLRMHVAPAMFVSEAVALVCHKLRLGDPESFVFVQQSGHSVPPDSMVAPLLGQRDIMLMPISDAPAITAQIEQPKYRTAMDLISQYKSYNVVRKNPLSLRRHELVITLDGRWIHIMYVGR